MIKRTIGVFTGNRAEYGLQLPIIRAIESHPELCYRLIVSGGHLDEDFGRTLSEIELDGIEVYDEVKILMDETVSYATPQAIGTGIVSIAKTLSVLNPDIFLVYADRYEGFAALVAATQMNIPTAHIEGGDITEGGALDDSIRHAMTKLAHLHFTTNQEATNRIIAMGEEEWRVKTVGFPAIDLIVEGDFSSKEILLEKFDLDLDRPIIIYTQHSVTTEYKKAQSQIEPALLALGKLGSEGAQVIITYPNNDAGGLSIIKSLQESMSQSPAGVQLYPSLGRQNYHGLLSLARDRARVVCAGNSSSGIKETPAFGCPSINIGSRQDGRLRAENVLDVGYNENEIYSAIYTGINDESFRDRCRNCENPYGIGDAGKKIADILAAIPLGQDFIRKRMTIHGSQ